MKNRLAILALLSGIVCADEVRPVSADTAIIKFDEPVVPLGVCHNAARKTGSLADRGLDLFTVTGDDAHQPELRWVAQNTLRIKFAPGTSCTTGFRLEFKPEHAHYLGGDAMPERTFTFSHGPVKLDAEPVPGMEEGAYVVFPVKAHSREAKAFPGDSAPTFVYRQVLSDGEGGGEEEDDEEKTGDEAFYGASVPGVVEPALFKHVCTCEVIEELDAGQIDWAALTPDSPVPGVVLVRPQSPLPAGTTWRLFHIPAPGIAAGELTPFKVEADFAPYVSVGLPDNGRHLQLEVEFGAPVTCDEAMRAWRAAEFSAGAAKAEDDAEGGTKTLAVDGKPCHISFAGFKRARWEAEIGPDNVEMHYAPEGLVTGFTLTVEGEVPPVLDVELPAGITAALGRSTLAPHRCRLSLTPAHPAVGAPGAGHTLMHGPAWLLPLSGDHQLRLPVVDIASMKVEVYPLSAETVVVETRDLSELLHLPSSVADRYVRERIRFRQAVEGRRRIMEPDKLHDAALTRTWKDGQENRARAAAAHLQAVAGPDAAPAAGCTLDIPDTGDFIRRGEAVVDLDALAGGKAAPGYYLLHLTWHAVPAVCRALADLDLPEEMLDGDFYVLVLVSDLHAQTNKDAMVLTRLSDGRPVEQAQVTRYIVLPNDDDEVDDEEYDVDGFDVEPDEESDGEFDDDAEDEEAAADDESEEEENGGDAVPVSPADKPVKSGAEELQDGYLAIPPSFSGAQFTSFYLVRAGDDCVVVRSDDGSEEEEKEIIFILTDRDYYRPGDTVHVRALMRDVADYKHASIPKVDRVRLTVRRPDGSELFSRMVEPDATCGIDESFTLPDGDEDVTGSYEVEVSAGNGAYEDSLEVEVAVFRRNAFKVDFSLEAAPVHPTQFTIQVQAQDYNGTPVSHGKTRLEILSAVPVLSFNGIPAIPLDDVDDDDLDGAAVIDEEDDDDVGLYEDDDDDDDDEGDGMHIRYFRYSFETDLDSLGHATVETALEEYESIDANTSGKTFSVWGGVANDRAECVSVGREDAAVAKASAAGFSIQWQNDTLSLKWAGEDGEASPTDQTVRVELVRTSQEKEELPNGITFYRSRTAAVYSEEIVVPASRGGKVEWSLQDFLERAAAVDAGDGQYFLAFHATDSKGNPVYTSLALYDMLQRTVEGDFLCPWILGDMTPGEDGALHVPCQSVVPGYALFILTDEFKEVRHYVRPVLPGSCEFVLPLDGLEGEVEVDALLPRPDKDGDFIHMKRELRIVHLPITSGVLQVSLEVPAAPVRPKESVVLSGRVTKGGEGVPATVTLYAVDEGMVLDGGLYFRAKDFASAFIGGYRSTECGFFSSPVIADRAGKELYASLMPRLWEDDMSASRWLGGFSDDDDEGDDSALAGDDVDVDDGEDDTDGDAGAAADAEGADGEDDGDGPAVRYISPLRRDFRPLAVWRGTLKTDADGRFSTQAVLPDTCTTYRVYALAVGDDGATFGGEDVEFTVARSLVLTPGTPFFMSVGDTLRLPVTVTNDSDAEGTWTVSLSSAKEPQSVTVPAHSSATLYFGFTAKAEGAAVLEWTATGGPEGDSVQGSFPVRFPAPVLQEAHHIMLESGREVKLASLVSPELAGATGCEVEVALSANPLLHLAGCMDYLLEYPYGCTEQTASGLLPWLFYDRLAPLCPALAQTPADEVHKVVSDTVEKIFRRQREDGGLGYWADSDESCFWASAHAALVLTIAQDQGYGAFIPDDKMAALRGYLHTQYPCEKKAGLSPLTLYALGRVLDSKPCLSSALAHAATAEDKGAWWWHSGIQADLAFIQSIRKAPSKRHAAFQKWLRSRGRDSRHETTLRSAWTFIALNEYLRRTPAAPQEALVTLQDGLDLVLDQGVTVLKPQAERLADLPTILYAELGEVFVTFKVKGRPAQTAFTGVSGKGLQISRIYEKKGEDGVWREATEFAVGDVVRVTLTCTKTAPELQYVVVEDYLPSCMEAVNPGLPGQSAGMEETTWSQWFDHKEYLGDRVRGFCSDWQGGELLNMTYYARVMRAGSCTAPPAHVRLMYEPQTYSLSPNTKIQSK